MRDVAGSADKRVTMERRGFVLFRHHGYILYVYDRSEVVRAVSQGVRFGVLL